MVSSISYDYFVEFMEFPNSTAFLNWLIMLPDDSPIRLDGDNIVFHLENQDVATLSTLIDSLIKSMSETEGKT